MNYSKKNKGLGIYSVIIIFTLFCLSCDKKEIFFFAQGNGPDLVFEVAPNDSALCYISFQSEPNKSNEVDKENVLFSGNIDVSWASKEFVNDLKFDLSINNNKILLKDTFSLTVSTMVNKKEKFFYYNDVLKSIPALIENIKQSNNDIDSVFSIRASQQFVVYKINTMKPLSMELSAYLKNDTVSRVVNFSMEEREYTNPSDFPGVR